MAGESYTTTLEPSEDSRNDRTVREADRKGGYTPTKTQPQSHVPPDTSRHHGPRQGARGWLRLGRGLQCAAGPGGAVDADCDVLVLVLVLPLWLDPDMSGFQLEKRWKRKKERKRTRQTF